MLVQVTLRLTSSDENKKREPLVIFSKEELDKIFKPDLAKNLVALKEKKEAERLKQTVTSRPKV